MSIHYLKIRKSLPVLRREAEERYIGECRLCLGSVTTRGHECPYDDLYDAASHNRYYSPYDLIGDIIK